MLDYKKRLELAKLAKENDIWVNIKAKIIKRYGMFNIKLEHETGRISIKKEHYFASEYAPTVD